MDIRLVRKSFFNSILLAALFGVNTGGALATGNWLFGVVGALATYFTINDAVNLYYVIKNFKEQNNGQV